MPAKHKNIKLQLAGQQTLRFVRKTTKYVDNENLGNTNTGSDTQVLLVSDLTYLYVTCTKHLNLDVLV